MITSHTDIDVTDIKLNSNLNEATAKVSFIYERILYYNNQNSYEKEECISKVPETNINLNVFLKKTSYGWKIFDVKSDSDYRSVPC